MKLNPRKHSIRFQLGLASLGFSLILAMFITTVSYQLFQGFLLRSQRQATQNSLQLIGNELNTDMSRFVMLANWCTVDSELANYLQTVSGLRHINARYANSKQMAISAWNHLSAQATQSLSVDYLLRCVVSTNKGEHFLQIQPSPFTGNRGVLTQNILNADFFEPLLKADGPLWFGPVPNPTSSFSTPTVLPIVRPIYRSISTGNFGWVYLEVNPALITDRLANYQLPSDAALYIRFSDKYSFRYADGRLLPAGLPEGGYVSYRLSELPWSIHQTLSQKELNVQKQLYMGILCGIVLVIILLGFGLKLLMDRLITLPVSELLARLKKMETGDLSHDRDTEWHNELGDIGRGINALGDSLEELMDKKVQAEKERQELKYKILQSQINPHFLYNTLGSIKWMAQIQGADGIADMTTALARLLKNVAKGTQEFIPLSDELAILHDYFTIMRFRYGGSIELEENIENPGLYRALVQRFSLQPMMENAIFHGIEPKGGPGLIQLRASAQGDILQLEIRDNGVGMSPEKIRAVLSSGTPAERHDFFADLGIANVQQRIQFSFGPRYGIHIESREGLYTSIRLQLPLLYSEAELNQQLKEAAAYV